MHLRYILDTSKGESHETQALHGCGSRAAVSRSTFRKRLFAHGRRRGSGGWGPFHFDFDDERRSEAAGAADARRRRMFGSGELRLVLLKLIADEPRHGYDLIRAIEELTGGEYAPSPGVVYPTLTLLQDMGLIEEAAGEGPRKPFQVTDEGRAHLEEKAEEVEALFERLEDLAPERAHHGGAGDRAGGRESDDRAQPPRRPRRLRRGLLHEITAILDEAAQRIERVK